MKKPLIDLGSMYIDPVAQAKYDVGMRRLVWLMDQKLKCILDGIGYFTDEEEEELNELAEKVLDFDPVANIKPERIEFLN